MILIKCVFILGYLNMIFGIGIDITSNTRIADLYKKFGQRFLNRVYTDTEIQMIKKIKSEYKVINFLAKRYAAKEAFAKAIKTGIGRHLSFIDIEVLSRESGEPFINLSDKAIKYLSSVCSEVFQCHISLCDEGDTVSAFVIIEKI